MVASDHVVMSIPQLSIVAIFGLYIPTQAIGVPISIYLLLPLLTFRAVLTFSDQLFDLCLQTRSNLLVGRKVSLDNTSTDLQLNSRALIEFDKGQVHVYRALYSLSLYNVPTGGTPK